MARWGVNDGRCISRTSYPIEESGASIRQRTGKIMLTNAIETGRGLKKAKALLPHGKWGK
ncbi:DUF3102 domain-containing protein [Desulfosporosinus youngiae]|uniref:DUF3102 domain-containing protein n=1 Tax=Desulfosporosinus youngiae TaxID=339862 RepID=UPI0002DC276D